MDINDLKKSISEMTSEDLMEVIAKSRAGRRLGASRAPKKKSSIGKLVASLNAEEIERMLAELGGKDGAS